MTTLIFLLFASLLISQTPQETPELAEATELTKSVVKLFREGNFDEALPLAKRALEIRERLLPPTDQRVSLSLGYLGDVYMAKRDYSSARKAFERLLTLQEQRLSATDVNLAFTLDRLALLSFRDGKPEKSEELYQRSLAIREKAFGAESVQVADTLYSMGQLYRMRGKYDRALDSYKHSLMIYGRSKGAGAAEFQRASTGISCVGYESGNHSIFKEAEAIQKRFAPGLSFAPPAQILNGRAVFLAKPEYPTAARAWNLEGAVVVQVEIDEKGRVTDAKDMCGAPPYLDEVAIKAAYKSRFSPTTLSGVSAKVKGVIVYNFIGR